MDTKNQNTELTIVILDRSRKRNGGNHFFQEKVTQQEKKLAETRQALYDALHKQQMINEDLERVKKEKAKLSETVLEYNLYVAFFYAVESCKAF